MQNSDASAAPPKSKADLKQERREKQEAQRLAKLADKAGKAGSAIAAAAAKPEKAQPKPSPIKPQTQQKQPKQGKSKADKKPAAAPVVVVVAAASASQKETPGAAGEEGKQSTSVAPTLSGGGGRPDKSSGQQALGVMRMDDPAHYKKSIRQLHKKQLQPRPQEPVRANLFNHLSQPDKRVNALGRMKLGQQSAIHPAFLMLGIDVDEGRITGSNQRCIDFLRAVCALVGSFPWTQTSTLSNVDKGGSLARTFHTVLDRHVTFVDQCRPLPATVRNAVQYLKRELASYDAMTPPDEMRKNVLESIENFTNEFILLACKEIANIAAQTIHPGELVCTYGHSSLVADVLISAWATKRFSVLVVDSRPRCDGRRMFMKLRKAGIPCELTHIAALPMFAPKVSLTMMGAHSLLSNGYVISAIGTAQVANIISKVSHTPVLICAETYKFWERAQSDAFEFNELGDPDEIWRGLRGAREDWRHPANPEDADDSCGLKKWRDKAATGASAAAPTTPNGVSVTDNKGQCGSNLVLLNLMYDVVPPELVSAVVTELGTIPTTSVPVVLRVKQPSVDDAGSFISSISIT